eukprot:1704602-Pyramimonas_sp.AAC.1
MTALTYNLRAVLQSPTLQQSRHVCTSTRLLSAQGSRSVPLAMTHELGNANVRLLSSRKSLGSTTSLLCRKGLPPTLSGRKLRIEAEHGGLNTVGKRTSLTQMSRPPAELGFQV